MFCSCLCDVWNRQKEREREREREREKREERRERKANQVELEVRKEMEWKTPRSMAAIFVASSIINVHLFSWRPNMLCSNRATLNFSPFSLQQFRSKVHRAIHFNYRFRWKKYGKPSIGQVSLSIEIPIFTNLAGHLRRFRSKLQISVTLVLAYESYLFWKTF